MMSDATFTVLDGALGIAGEDSTNTHVKCGYTTAGQAGVLRFYTDPATLVSEQGAGPAVEAAAFALGCGASPVGVMPTGASTAGVVGSVAASRVGGTPSTGTVSTTGTPVDALSVLVTILKGGATGTATYAVSLDNGVTPSAETVTGGSKPLAGTGLTLVFSGSFNAGDSFAFTTQAPSFTSGDLGTALTSLLADPRDWGGLHIVGSAGNLASQLVIGTAVEAALAGAEADHRWTYALVELPDDTDANIQAATASFAGSHVTFCGATENIVSKIRGTLDRRNIAWGASARIAKNRISRDAAAFVDGGIPGVVSLNRDEARTPGLDASRIMTMRTYRGQNGFYLTSAKTMAPAGSDFKFLTYRRVINQGCKVGYGALLAYVNVEVRVNSKTGRILETDARAIDARVTGLLRQGLAGDCSDVYFRTNRTDNMLSLQKLRGDVRIVPFAYAREVSSTIALDNPALSS